MQQLHNELIASPDDGGLVGARHAITNDVIISDTMLRSLAPPQLIPMTDNHKMMCGCAICNTSKYMQESLNVWRQKKLKTMKDKAENSRGRGEYELTQAYKSYADYAFPDRQNCHPCCKNAAYYILCTPTNDECKVPNWKCVTLPHNTFPIGQFTFIIIWCTKNRICCIFATWMASLFLWECIFSI